MNPATSYGAQHSRTGPGNARTAVVGVSLGSRGHNTSQGSIGDAPQHRASLRSEVSDMSIYDEYRIVINEAQRRVIMRALTNAMANDRLLSKDGALSHPTQNEYMQLIRLFSTIEPSVAKQLSDFQYQAAGGGWPVHG